MGRDEIISELNDFIAGFLKEQGLELVELTYRQEGRDLVLRVLVDKPEGGISLGECTLVNNRLGVSLEEKGIIQESYILEVSSPGLDRPLKTKADFLRYRGRAAKFFLNTPIEGRIELDGAIIDADDETVRVEIAGRQVAIPLSCINKAKQLIGGF